MHPTEPVETCVVDPPQLAWSQTEPETEEPTRWRLPDGSVRTFGIVVALGVATLTVMLSLRPVYQTPAPVTTPFTTSIPETTQTNIALPAFVPPSETATHLIPPQPIPPPPTPPTDTPDQRFLTLLLGEGYVIYNPSEAISVGHQACANLAITHNIYQTELYVRDVLGIRQSHARDLTAAASVVYCPNTPY